MVKLANANFFSLDTSNEHVLEYFRCMYFNFIPSVGTFKALKPRVCGQTAKDITGFGCPVEEKIIDRQTKYPSGGMFRGSVTAA